jgi:tryptophan-rich sensory protein
MKRGINWKALIISLLIVFFVAFIGSRFTIIDSWYESIKPGITPPNYVFPIVWSILFFLIALSLYFAWTTASRDEDKRKIIYVFAVNLILNVFWSFMFFYLQNPAYAFVIIILLWLSILRMVFVLYKIDKKASYLLIPYLLWVAFASVLNYLIVF